MSNFSNSESLNKKIDDLINTIQALAEANGSINADLLRFGIQSLIDDAKKEAIESIYTYDTASSSSSQSAKDLSGRRIFWTKDLSENEFERDMEIWRKCSQYR